MKSIPKLNLKMVAVTFWVLIVLVLFYWSNYLSNPKYYAVFLKILGKFSGLL